MEDFDKYLDQLVENFFDTGKLVLNETTDSINWDKIGKVIRDPNKSEQIYELLIDMFPNAKEVIDYNYYGDNEEPSPIDTFAEMKSFLWNIDKNTIKGPDLRLSTGFEIDGEYKKDLETYKIAQGDFIKQAKEVNKFVGLSLLYNHYAVILGVVYTYLPFMILPLYGYLVKFDLRLIDAIETCVNPKGLVALNPDPENAVLATPD